MSKFCFGFTLFRFTLALATSTVLLQLCAAQNGAAAIRVAQTMVVAAAVATGSAYPDAPSAAARDDVSGPTAKPAHFVGASPAAKGGLNRAIDRKYVAVTSAMLAAAIVNAEKTNTCIEQHTCTYVPAELRSRAGLYGVGIPAVAGIAYLGYRIKERGHRWWFVPAAAVSAANAYVACHAGNEPGYPPGHPYQGSRSRK